MEQQKVERTLTKVHASGVYESHCSTTRASRTVRAPSCASGRRRARADVWRRGDALREGDARNDFEELTPEMHEAIGDTAVIFVEQETATMQRRPYVQRRARCADDFHRTRHVFVDDNPRATSRSTDARAAAVPGEPEYKAEIKFHGRPRPADERDAKYYTDSMLLKVAGLLRIITSPNLTHVLPEDILCHILGSMSRARDVELAAGACGTFRKLAHEPPTGRTGSVRAGEITLVETKHRELCEAHHGGDDCGGGRWSHIHRLVGWRSCAGHDQDMAPYRKHGRAHAVQSHEHDVNVSGMAVLPPTPQGTPWGRVRRCVASQRPRRPLPDTICSFKYVWNPDDDAQGPFKAPHDSIILPPPNTSLGYSAWPPCRRAAGCSRR